MVFRDAAEHFAPYVERLARLCQTAEATDGDCPPLGSVVVWTLHAAHGAHAGGNTVVFVGNGSSAVFVSRCTIDGTRITGLRAAAVNDAAALTCFGDDFGYEEVFVRQVTSRIPVRQPFGGDQWFRPADECRQRSRDHARSELYGGCAQPSWIERGVAVTAARSKHAIMMAASSC